MQARIIIATIVGCLVTAMALRTAVASNIAFDTAGDSAYNNGWTNGSNGGYGWGGGWSFQAGDTSVTTTMQIAADPALGGIMNSPSVLDGHAWAVTNAAPTRQFASPLTFGQTFSVDMDGGSSGIAIGFFDPPDDTQDFYITSINNRDYMFVWDFGYRGGPSISDTGVAAVDGPAAVSLTFSDSMGYVLQIQSLAVPGVSASIDAGFTHIPAGAVEMAGAASSVLYVNNMTITPEPSEFLLTGVATLGLLRRRARLPKGA